MVEGAPALEIGAGVIKGAGQGEEEERSVQRGF